MKRLCGMMGVILVAALSWFWVAGCESTSTADSAITVTPSAVTLTDSNRTVMLAASLASSNKVLVLPLNWSVSDPSLGTIKASQGLSAVYESTGHVGNNTVTVRDQASSDGLALITQQ